MCVYGSVGSTFMRVKSRQSDRDTERTEKQRGVRKETQCHFNAGIVTPRCLQFKAKGSLLPCLK